MKQKKINREVAKRTEAVEPESRKLSPQEEVANHIISLLDKFDTDYSPTSKKVKDLIGSIQTYVGNLPIDIIGPSARIMLIIKRINESNSLILEPSEISVLTEMIPRLRENPNEFSETDKSILRLIFESYLDSNYTSDLSAPTDLRQNTITLVHETIDPDKYNEIEKKYLQNIAEHKKYYLDKIQSLLSKGKISDEDHQRFTEIVENFFQFVIEYKPYINHTLLDEPYEEKISHYNLLPREFIGNAVAKLNTSMASDFIKRELVKIFNLRIPSSDIILIKEQILNYLNIIAQINKHLNHVVTFINTFHKSFDITFVALFNDEYYKTIVSDNPENLEIETNDINLEGMTLDNIAYLLKQKRIPKAEINRLTQEIFNAFFYSNPDLRKLNPDNFDHIQNFHTRYTAELMSVTDRFLKN